MVLGKNSSMVARGQARPAESTEQPQGAGDTCTMQTPAGRGSTGCWKGAAADQNCNCSWGSTQSLESYTRAICSCEEGTEDPRSQCQINSSQLRLHPLLLSKRNKKCSLCKTQIRRGNLSGSKSILSVMVMAKYRNLFFTHPSVLIINYCMNTKPPLRLP